MLKKYLFIFFLSMVPVIELRGAIPFAVNWELDYWTALTVCAIGNMLPVPFIYFFARKILHWGADKKYIGKFFTFCIEKGEIRILGKARGSRQANNLLVQEIGKAGGVDFGKPLLLGYTGLSDTLLQKYISQMPLVYPLTIVVTFVAGLLDLGGLTWVLPSVLAIAVGAVISVVARRRETR